MGGVPPRSRPPGAKRGRKNAEGAATDGPRAEVRGGGRCTNSVSRHDEPARRDRTFSLAARDAGGCGPRRAGRRGDWVSGVSVQSGATNAHGVGDAGRDSFRGAYDAVALTNNVLVPTRLNVRETLVNGKASLLYKPTANSSVYGMVASAKQPPGANFTASTSASP